MAINEELAGRVRAVLADRTDVEEKKMLGGLSFMVADFTGRPTQGLVCVDNGTLADPEALRTWVHRGTGYVAAHPAAAKRRKRG